MWTRALPSLLLVTSLAACGTARTELGTGAAPAAAEGPAPISCAAPTGAARGELPYAYAALSSEMKRLRDPGRGAFDVRRVLDKVADAVDTLPDPEGVGTRDAAMRIRGEVTRLVGASPGQGQRAQATRRALGEAHGVLRRLAEGPCSGDAALLHRIDQLAEAVQAIPDDPELAHVPLLPILTALSRTQGALLALSTADRRRPRTDASAQPGPVASRAADGSYIE